MFKSNIQISTKSKSVLQPQITQITLNKKFVINKQLKRKIYLDIFLEATITRRDATQRLRLFDCGLDIIRHSKNIKTCIVQNRLCFAIQGKSNQNNLIEIHVREDRNNKDKRLVLISMFTIK